MRIAGYPLRCSLSAYERADGSTVDNVNRQELHLENRKFRPNKPNHFCVQAFEFNSFILAK